MFDTIQRTYELAQERNMSVYSLCRKCGIAPSILATNKKRNGQLNIDTIERICYSAGITFADFFNAAPEDHY